jgi:hypothetical protein
MDNRADVSASRRGRKALKFRREVVEAKYQTGLLVYLPIHVLLAREIIQTFSSTSYADVAVLQEPVAQPTHIANAGEEQQALAKDKLYQWWHEGNTDAPLKMARAEQAIAKKQTETPEFKRFFGDWDAAAKVKPETKPSLLALFNQRQFP